TTARSNRVRLGGCSTELVGDVRGKRCFVAGLLHADRAPARQAQRDRRRSARFAANVEASAEQSDTLAASDETEASSLGAVEQGARHVEDHAVILEPRVDSSLLGADHDPDVSWMRMLANVREGSFNHPEERDL